MIRRLRLRLATVCAAMTGALLIVLALMAAALTLRNYEAPREELFQAQLQQLVTEILTSRSLSNAWLGEMEAQNRLVVSIEDNGAELFFPGSWSPPTPRAALIERVRSEAEARGFDRRDFSAMTKVTQQVTFLLSGEAGDDYRCAVARVQTPRGRFCLTVAADRSAETAYLRGVRAAALALAAAGAAALFGVSFIVAGIAVRPARRSLEEQNRFLAAASHDLRSPLAAVTACASSILLEPERTQEHVKTISRECARLGRLLDDLLVLSSAGDAAWKLRREPLSLDTLLIEAVEGLTPMARGSGHALTLSLPGEEELPAVLGDETRLRQALYNLIANAIAHAGGEGPIEVTGRRAGGRVAVEVADHGAGIPDAEKKRVFQRFYRADPARAGRAHSGLGLSIAWEIARLHGGRLTLRDTPGGGCTFTLLLPVAP